MDMNEAQSKTLERGLNDATALSQDEWRGVALAMIAQCQPWYEELERLRTAADGLNSWLGTRRDDTLARSDEMFGEIGSTEYQFHGGQAMAFNEAKIKGIELGLWK